jgi:hypothetical protein
MALSTNIYTRALLGRLQETLSVVQASKVSQTEKSNQFREAIAGLIAGELLGKTHDNFDALHAWANTRKNTRLYIPILEELFGVALNDALLVQEHIVAVVQKSILERIEARQYYARKIAECNLMLARTKDDAFAKTTTYYDEYLQKTVMDRRFITGLLQKAIREFVVLRPSITKRAIYDVLGEAKFEHLSEHEQVMLVECLTKMRVIA